MENITIELKKSWIQDSNPEVIKRMTPEKIIGKNNLIPISFLRQGVERSSPVCHLRYESGGAMYVATGFMISPSLLMTNYHVFETKQSAQNANAYFKYEAPLIGEIQKDPIKRSVKPNQFFYACKALDLVIVAIDELPGIEFGFIPLLKSPDKAGNYERVNIIQHPVGRKKELSLQENRISQFFTDKIHYFADTQGGSSGSPVFDNKWQLVALHHAGSFSHNEGIRISSICKKLESEIKPDSDKWGKVELHNELLNHIS